MVAINQLGYHGLGLILLNFIRFNCVIYSESPSGTDFRKRNYGRTDGKRGGFRHVKLTEYKKNYDFSHISGISLVNLHHL